MIRKNGIIQYVSSLHVDKFEKTVGVHFVKPVANILVLNGNIGSPYKRQTYDFLNYCSRIWRDIIYIPGPEELQKEPNKNIEYMKRIFSPFKNVHILNNDSVNLNNILFFGTAYDTYWLENEFHKHKELHRKKVALTYVIPDNNMVHPIDSNRKQYTNKQLPNFDAWICGYIRGAHTFKYNNNMIAAYNARGAIDGKNDFSQKLGWSLSSTIQIF
jgi:hypothetical protein